MNVIEWKGINWNDEKKYELFNYLEKGHNIAWEEEDRMILFNFISKEKNITYDDAKYVIEEGEKNMLKLCREHPDFYQIHLLNKEFTDELIEKCKIKNWSNNNPYL